MLLRYLKPLQNHKNMQNNSIKSKCMLIMIMLCSNFPPIVAQTASNKLYRNETVEQLEAYRVGNAYQKDFLLFIDMLKTTHPAFAPHEKSLFNIDSIAKTGYDKLKICQSFETFSQFLTSIASLLRDGHTYVQSNLNRNGIFYHFQVMIDFPNVHLIVAPKEYEAHLGKQIVRINNYPVWDVINSFKTCMSSDNDIYWHTKVGQYMQWFSLWEDNFFVRPDSTLVLSLSDGYDITLIPKPLPKTMNDLAVYKVNKPQVNTVTQFKQSPFFYTVLEKESICYFQFNQCVDNSTLRYQNYVIGAVLSQNEEDRIASYPRFDTLVAKMFANMSEKNVQTLVVDVRNNAGGNSTLCNILLSYLKPVKSMQSGNGYMRVSPFWQAYYPIEYENAKKAVTERKQVLEMGKLYLAATLSPQNEDTDFKKKMEEYFIHNKEDSNIFPGNVIFIQGKKTYSSAGLLIVNAVDNNIGKVIGEKSTYKPCHYGDILTWELPNTKIKGGVSYKIFNRPNESRCEESYLTPEVLLETHWDDYLQDHGDLCWNWVIEHYGK
jgi:hypothetical protein